MTTLNAYYSHESAVGPVFDVAHFSPFKSLWMAIVGLGFGVAIGVAAAYVWNPDWLVPRPPEWFADANREARDWMQEHPLGVQIGVGVAGLFSLLLVAAALSGIANALSGSFYIRVGVNGLSLRVPDGFIGKFERDLDWSEIAKLTVVQEKYVGSLSRNAGNIGGELQLRTHDGLNRVLRLDCFREDAWLIYQRIEEAMNTRPAMFA
jgi:hypothetical protein